MKTLAEEADPYIELNEKVEAALAGIESISGSLENAESKEEFAPSVMKTVMVVLKDLSKTLRDVSGRDMKPNIIVQAPDIKMPAPNVSIRTDTPKKWECEVRSRDEDGRIKTFTIEAQ